MQGAIICKFNGEIPVLATGEYDEMDKLFDIYLKITPGKQLRCIEVTDIDIGACQIDQIKATQELERFFN